MSECSQDENPATQANPPRPRPMTPCASPMEDFVWGKPPYAPRALTLGLCSLIPAVGAIFGLFAVIMAIFALAKRGPGRGMAVSGLVIGILGITLLPIEFGILLPALAEHSRELAREAGCQADLSALSKAAVIYAAEHIDAEGRQVYPASLDEFISEGLIAPRALHCPSVDHSIEQQRVYDYFYLPPAGGDDTLISCDFRGNHPSGGRCCAYLMGHIMFCKSEQAFQTELAKPQNAKFAAALRQAEGP